MSASKKLILISVILLVLDQCVKFWIKTSLTLGEEIRIFDWFRILFVENPGMAFGMKFGEGNVWKILLTCFRIVASAGIIWYIRKLIKEHAPMGVLVCVTLILCGALGNLIDSIFYGVIFSASTYYQVAEFLPEGGGYTSLLCGKVVDMLYFPIIQKGDFIFFRPVFNFADSYITIGAAILILFYRNFFSSTKQENEQQES